MVNYENKDEDDYYRIILEEGKLYKITVMNMEDLSGYKLHTMITDIRPQSNTNTRYIISNDTINDNYVNKSKLFRAGYTGNYYIRFWNTACDTKYSFIIEYYDPAGKDVNDSNGNTYKITGDDTLELTKVASKKSKSFYFNSSKTFSDIEGFEIVNYYDSPFVVTSIGKYAFKNCNIKSISIPEEVKKIGVGAFQNCKKLGTEKYIMGVVIRGKNVIIEKDAFKDCKKLGTIRVLKSASIKSVKKMLLREQRKVFVWKCQMLKSIKKSLKRQVLRILNIKRVICKYLNMYYIGVEYMLRFVL